MRFPIKTMKDYEKKGWAIQATMGGLVLGRSHDEGGIFVWIKNGNHYVLEAEIEGYEYILNPGAACYYKKIFPEFNKPYEHKYLGSPSYDPPAHITLLDTQHPMEPKFLLFELGHFAIINKYSSSGYLDTLDKMNKAVTYKFITADQAQVVVNSREIIIKRFFDQEEGFIAPPQ